MDKSKILEKILRIVPEIQSDVNNEIDFMGNEEALHVILGNALGSFLREKLQYRYEQESLEFKQMEALFSLFEELAATSQYFKDLLQVSILEPLTDQKIWEDNMKQYLGPISKDLLDHIHTYIHYPQ